MSDNENDENNERQNENLNIVEKKKGGSQKKSWVWDWFKTDSTGALCQVEIATGQLCNRHYKHGSSTGNLINHLTNKHQITGKTKKQDYVVRIKII
jgi:hypothetical protein